MLWIWGLWAAAVVLMLGSAIAMESSMVANRINGANGLMLLVTLIMVGFGSLVVAITTWVMRGGLTALVVLGMAGLAIWAAFTLTIFITDRILARHK